MELLGDHVMDYLPFSSEPLLSWGVETDLLRFLLELNDIDGVLVTADGNRGTVNYKDFGAHVYHAQKRRMLGWAHRFTESAEKSIVSYKGKKESVELPDFYEHPSFGETSKYIVAWEGVVSSALTTGTFFSIAHVKESIDDLNCALTLAAELYYKHSFQVLRGFLEDLVLPLYFANNPQAFSAWQANSYRTPALRGRGNSGILNELTEAGTITDDLANEVSTLYGNLNHFVHGKEERLLNNGFYTREWIGHAFRLNNYLEWCQYVKRAVTVAIHLLRINLSQWERLKENNNLICPICNSSENFDSEKFVFGGEEFTKYYCRLCGDEFTQSFDGRRAYGQSFDGELLTYQY